MTEPVAIVGLGAILPDAPDVATFWANLQAAKYSVRDVPPDRWDPELYFDPDPKAADRTYSKVGGWVRDWEWAPLEWHLPIPPKVGEAMDDAQKWAIACTRAALLDYGWPCRAIDTERTAVIVGNAMGGEKHYRTSLRIATPELVGCLRAAPSFAALPAAARAAIEGELRGRIGDLTPGVTEDTMPGELGNCIAGRVANIFDFRGPNFVVDAACASALAALDASVAGLSAGEFDLAISGGVDRNMGATTFVKFCKIGALSATGTRPFDEGADGFVMGEGAALFVLKRLRDAERDGDRVYAVVRGIGGSSDGRGKGITAPNPAGQELAVTRAWRASGLSPASCSMVEAHGTSTRVGDVVEVESLTAVFASAGVVPGSIALGSVKSNFGHLKAAAGAAGLLKTVLALHGKAIPPSLSFRRPNPNIDWSTSPFHVNTELTEWKVPADAVRCAGVSAFGFGGTNFHAVLEEYIPGRLAIDDHHLVAAGGLSREALTARAAAVTSKAPQRGTLVLGAASESEVAGLLRTARDCAVSGTIPALEAPSPQALAAPERVAIDFADADDLIDKAAKALAAVGKGAASWKLLQGRGIFRGSGAPGKVAFLYTGQGSQYPNMLAELRRREPVVAAVFDEADEIMTPLIGRCLSEIIFVDPASEAAVSTAESELRRTEITQPAVLAVDIALTRLLAEYGVHPDLVMGHSLGEYGALVAAGGLSFASALEAVSARGREMANLSIEDAGLMAAVSGPLEEVEDIVAAIDGNVVVANVNSTRQSVIGGATAAVIEAEEACRRHGFSIARLPVSHAFHTSIVAPASEPLRRTLERLEMSVPVLPIISNVTGDFYPTGHGAVPEMIDLLARQVASPVQFVSGLRRLADAGVGVFVEVGPKWALRGFVADVFGDDPHHEGLVNVATNHPKAGDVVTFNQALCGLFAAGLGASRQGAGTSPAPVASTPVPSAPPTPEARLGASPPATEREVHPSPGGAGSQERDGEHVYLELGHLFADFLDRGRAVYAAAGDVQHATTEAGSVPEPVVITGAALGTPGTRHVFDDANLGRLLAGEQFIDVVPTRIRHEMLQHRITRLVKSDDGAAFESIDSPNDVVKLAARAGAFDLGAEFGIDAERVAAYGRTTQLAVAAGIDALRDAGIPLAMRYRTTHLGTMLPERWGLPGELRDSTGVIFASAFPGFEEFGGEVREFAVDQTRREEVAELEAIRERLADVGGADVAREELDRRLHDLHKLTEDHPYQFDRRFLFRVLSMGHSQFADLVGARGPNTQVNAACSSTTQAVAIAQDWIRAGRCRRVVVLAADDVTSDGMLGWFASGFLASGAAATDDDVAEAALPFDRRRHGMILGMGAAALVVESAESARERGLAPICEVIGTATANSAFHGTRLDVEHIGAVMEGLIAGAETSAGIRRHEMAPSTVFVSHETYTPARGGSASAEIFALRKVFGDDADRVVIANTKGVTGHPMAVGLEDVVAVKALETGIVPPVANYREPDPELGTLNLSRGGSYPVEFALRLSAGFGSQIGMLLLRRTPPPDGRRRSPDELGFGYRIADRGRFDAWLSALSGNPAPILEEVNRQLRLAETAGETIGAPGQDATTPGQTATPAHAGAGVLTDKVTTGDGGPIVERGSAETGPIPETTMAKATADDVTDRVVALVAEQTGYPPEMLAPDLDLEADLGIDTVKQAELFARIREEYGIERDEGLRLRDYPTLAHVVGFVRERAALSSTPQASPPPESPGSPSTADTADDVTDRVVALVAEQTGYPPEMLAPDLDLEADLGIDTVKQAELFARIREEYGIERDEGLRLRDYPTLAHVVGFVRERAAGESGPPVVAEAVENPVEHPAEAGDERVPGFSRRIPSTVLLPELERCAATRVALGPSSRVLVMADAGGVAGALVSRLEQLGVETLLLDGALDAEGLTATLTSFRQGGEITGVYWLPALDDEGPLSEICPSEWREAIRRRVKLLAVTMRQLYRDIAGTGTFLLGATRLGGRHGYDVEGATAPMGGGVTGFAKAYGRERPDALVKCVDFALEAQANTVGEALVAETLRDGASIEVGYAGGRRWGVGLVEEEVTDEREHPLLAPDSVIVVSGAAGSIVSAVIADLARCGGTFHLLDLVTEPDAADPDLARYVTDRSGLKRDLASRLEASGARATPALVERELARIERAKAAADAMGAVRAAGGTVSWHQVDLTDAAAVAAVIGRVRGMHSSIDLLLHCAGAEISHLLDAKPQEEFDRVFDVKCDGWYHLLSALSGMPVGAAVVFGSIAGRFGNAGQTDYSAANDLLCKMTSSLRSQRPATRGIAFDWTAWASIGMASRGSIPKMMELAGIETLPVEVGVHAVRRELGARNGGGEVVVAGRLGTMAADGREAARLVQPYAAATGSPLLGGPCRWTLQDGLVVEPTLDPAKEPFLHDHRIEGTAVLPGAMGVEAFAEIAVAAGQGLRVLGLDDVSFIAPVKFFRDEARRLEILGRPRWCDDEIIADCRLMSRRSLADGSEQTVTHFSGAVRLGAASASPLSVPPVGEAAGSRVDRAAIYAVYFHGPAYQVLDSAWRWGDSVVGRLADGLPVDHTSTAGSFVTEPRLLELCFQTAGVVELGRTGRLGLPLRVGRIRFHPVEEPEGPWYAVVTVRPGGGGTDASVLDSSGRVRLTVEGYETVALPVPVDPSLVEAFRVATP